VRVQHEITKKVNVAALKEPKQQRIITGAKK
jgi:hypothetical protein